MRERQRESACRGQADALDWPYLKFGECAGEGRGCCSCLSVETEVRTQHETSPQGRNKTGGRQNTRGTDVGLRAIKKKIRREAEIETLETNLTESFRFKESECVSAVQWIQPLGLLQPGHRFITLLLFKPHISDCCSSTLKALNCRAARHDDTHRLTK